MHHQNRCRLIEEHEGQAWRRLAGIKVPGRAVRKRAKRKGKQGKMNTCSWWGTRAPAHPTNTVLLPARFISWRVNTSTALGHTHPVSLPPSWVMLPLKKGTQSPQACTSLPKATTRSLIPAQSEAAADTSMKSWLLFSAAVRYDCSELRFNPAPLPSPAVLDVTSLSPLEPFLCRSHLAGAAEFCWRASSLPDSHLSIIPLPDK